MLWATSTVAFFSFCRSGEETIPTEKSYDSMAHLSYNDISVDNRDDPSIIVLRLKKIKDGSLPGGCPGHHRVN